MADRPVSVRLSANVAPYIAAMQAAKRVTGDLYQEIDKTNDRTAWLAQGVLALAPAFTTLGAGAVPVISGLATQMTFAIGAAGTMALAFSGVGTALGALNEYQLDPSLDNLEELRAAMENIGPAGAEFVAFLDEIGPQFDQLRMTARESMFPGVTDGITEFMDLLPQLDSIVGNTAEAIGQLASEAGAGLAGPKFEAFFDYLESDAKPILLDMGRTFGNFMTGLADMMVAFAPMSADFSSGFLDMSRSFADWAANLGQSEGFQEFLSYVQEAAPKALDFVGSLIMAMVELAKAAAPVGDVALPLLTDLLDIVGAIADSPIGPAVIGFAAITSAIGRLSALGAITGSGALGKITQNVRGSVAAAREATPTFNQFGQSLYRAGQSAKYQSDQTKAAMAATRGFARGVAPIAGQVGLAAFAMSDLDDKVGLTNTTSLALMGSLIGGGPGAIAGGVVGAILDVRAAAGNASEAVDKMGSAIRAAGDDFGAQKQAISSTRSEIMGLQDSFYDDSLGGVASKMFDPQFWTEAVSLAKDGGYAYQQELERINAASEKLGDTQQGLYTIGMRLGQEWAKNENGGAALDDVESLRLAADRAEPAMNALGITLDDLAGMSFDEQRNAADQIAAWTRNADKASGRTDALAGAVSDLDNDMLSTADSAGALATALEALLSPQMNLSEATDAWTKSLRDLRGDLAAGNKTLTGNTNAALENRAAIRDRVTAMMQVLNAEAEAGASSQRLSRVLASQREALLQAGRAAGLSGKELRDYLRQLGFTPKVVRTIIEQVGAETTKREIRELQKDLNRYGLTRATAAAALNDVASGRIKTVQGLVDKYGLSRKEATALLNDQASGRIQQILNLLSSIRDKTVTVTTYYQSQGSRRGQVAAGNSGLADGGTVPGARLPYGDKTPILAAPGEEIISNRHGQADRFRADRAAGRIPAYADGGTVGMAARVQAAGASSTSRTSVAFAPAVVDLRYPDGSTQTVELVARRVANQEANRVVNAQLDHDQMMGGRR